MWVSDVANVHPIATLALTAALIAGGCQSSDFYSKQDIGAVNQPQPAAQQAAKADDDDIPDVPAADLEALATGTLGGGIGKDLSADDRKRALAAEYTALEYTPSGQEVTWGQCRDRTQRAL